MKLLSDLISSIKTISVIGSSDIQISGLGLDSRLVKESYLFAAIEGHTADGHNYIDKAISLGATAILCSKLPVIVKGITYIQVDNSSEVLGRIASAYYNNPSEKLQLIGVTGTNGKTSIATMLHDLFLKLGYSTGLLSTIKYSINKKSYTSSHTTPNSIVINQLLEEMVEAGCEYAFMEVSSHAIDQNRIAGLVFKGGIFTNLSHDHLDYHPTFKHYLNTKKKFFDELGSNAFALYNKDDKNGKIMVQNTQASCYTYSLTSTADFKSRIIESDFRGTLVNLNQTEAWFPLVGRFNTYNLTAVFGTAFLLDIENHEVIKQLTTLKPVAGRFNYVGLSNITGIVDYAHTPDALENVLDTINDLRTKNEQLITVVGCGGNRDKAKRPIMASVACKLSDRVIFTSDNPRDEEPEVILNEMMAGVEAFYYKKVLKISDRSEAIKTAVALANKGDVILIAGKGHETYQEIKGKRTPFNDIEVLTKNLKTITN